MKSLFTILFCCCAVMAAKAQRNISRNIDDDGKTMVVEIRGTNGGTSFAYKRTFDVTGISKEEKKALVNRIVDSLGIAAADTPPVPSVSSLPAVAPVSPVPPVPPAMTWSSSGSSKSTTAHQNLHSDIDDDGHTLHVRIKGTSNDKKVDYDRTFNIEGMTSQEKSKFIKNITDSLGVSPHVKIND